jgi:hypothetical protein
MSGRFARPGVDGNSCLILREQGRVQEQTCSDQLKDICIFLPRFVDTSRPFRTFAGQTNEDMVKSDV